ncbi:sensor histidine kinase [Pedobacter sp. SL55]|uniref:sensor histidine kinase n=1 Tax=Pedobacter sp. SL55 TaxID=2995161 RepID=UPI002270A5FC|nr:HAMP domain-containing sensor histidine kinase [Pedobacter sp. SL55]WAC42606.1 HAMP domain-containing sensor histidine kinase [Pedobacter sp. SL55]
MNKLTKQTKIVVYNYTICVFAAIALIITLNHYGLKAIDGIRAFTSGESVYMKAQQEASRHLTNYVFTGNPQHYQHFLTQLQVPVNDSLARLALDKNASHEVIKKHLLLGKNIPDDLDNIIWVYKNFKSLPHFQKAVELWKAADLLIIDLEKQGELLHQKQKSNILLSLMEKEELADKIDKTCKLITKKGNEFDHALTESSKLVNKTVLTINTSIAISVFLCIIIISIKYINRLSILQKNTMAQNNALLKINEELDLFTHSVSHDLRSPITSLKGIIALAEKENSEQERSLYFRLMSQILSRQDDFILKIIQLSKNKRLDIEIQEINLFTFFESVVNDLKHGQDFDLEIKYNIQPIVTKIDSFRLDIISRNLISNALKYADPNKANRFIHISADLTEGFLQINFEDNGLGIAEEHLGKIFDMFYVTTHHNKGSGIGLYLVKEMVNKLGGEIVATSTLSKGSVFSIKLPVML